MATISVSLPADGSTADVADYNTPITTIVNEINGALDNSNVSASAAIATSKLATDAGIATGMIADDAVTPAKWTNPYCFHAYASGSTTIADNSNTKVLFATEVYDHNNNFSGSTYTAPVTGVYHFDGRVAFDTAIASGVLAYTVLYVNGSPVLNGMALSTAYTTAAAFTFSGDYTVTAGQTVELWMFQNSDGTEATQASAAGTWFSGHLVHPT